jgi:Alpha/beta hydrolase domain
MLVGIALLAVALSVGGAAASAASPTVTGPVSGGSGAILPPNLNGFDLAQVGYEQSEYFLEGTANAYVPTAPLTSDGMWSVTPGTASTVPPVPPAAYKTREVVYRPIDPNKFNGTVIVEWLNVSGLVDANPDWTQTHNELIRDGFAWVGVSAQAVGLNQLKCPAPPDPLPPTCPTAGDPSRYGTLTHPGDSYSYDIFSQAGQAIRDNPAQILGGLTPKKLIAAGESQSAGRMVTYIDAVQPLAHVYDGFLVHSRGAGGAALLQPPATATAVNTPSPTLIRTDLDVPVFVFQTESDVAGGFTARQPDSNEFRQWEAAGTSHFDTYGLLIGPSDTGDGQGAVANLAAMQNPTKVPGPGGLCTQAINTGGAHWLLNSAIYWLNQWVTNGTPPPIGQPLQIATTSPTFTYAKDANGNALGGVRTPQVDAPIATLAGIGNTAANGAAISQFCRLFGSTVPFTPQQLATLYKNHGKFVSAWSNDIQDLVNGGFLLPADGVELQNAAGSSTIGK